jgi:alginate O-acetyltransferase complex protein AlgI
MLFNTFEYLAFLAATVAAYYALSTVRQRMVLLVAASYVFYSVWSIPYTLLMAGTTCWYYFTGARIAAAEDEGKRRLWMIVGIAGSLSVLVYYKYKLFFAVSVIDVLELFGLHFQKPNWDIVLPLGISFHTFQGVSYAMDVYRRTTAPTKDFLSFAVYSSFFPQLIAGPIERKGDMLPQLQAKQLFDWENFRNGINLILLGLFKKVVIADNLAGFADPIFADPSKYSSIDLLLGAYAFSLQIYFDFSAYSQIAIGSALLLGINLSQNFNAPYMAVNIVDFWRRWHMTLSRWLRDYLYIPLGGSRVWPLRRYFNLIATMVLGGLWHGANWTFVVWGAYHGILLSINHLFRRWRGGRETVPTMTPWKMALSILVIFHAVTLGWIVFRAPSLQSAVAYLSGLVGDNQVAMSPKAPMAMGLMALVAAVWTINYLFRERIAHLFQDRVAERLYAPSIVVQASYLIVVVAAIAIGADYGTGKFIYFEF